MKNITFLLFFLSLAFASFSQSYLGVVNKQVNFRQGPGKDFDIISSLSPGTNLFIVSLETTDDFINVIDINTNKEGYIHKSFVKIGREIKENESGFFSPSGTTSDYNPSVEVFNNTDLALTLKLNNETYLFETYEKKTITLSPGSCVYRASAPGVIPNFGTEHLQSNQDYTWQFYIRTRRK
jgi:uncharacterized protein YgiM (DUF1202 family)